MTNNNDWHTYIATIVGIQQRCGIDVRTKSIKSQKGRVINELEQFLRTSLNNTNIHKYVCMCECVDNYLRKSRS